MSSSAPFHAGGGGDHGGTGEVPTHPKPPREGAIVTSGARRTHDLGQRKVEEENNNWDARRAGGGLTGPAEAHLGGEVIMDDVAFVAVDFEDEEEEVAETERWKLLGQPRACRGMSFSFGSAGSANNMDQLRSSGSSKPEEEDGIPQRVDAHDNFEQGEIPCSDAADQKLAKVVNNIKLHLVSEEQECSKMQNLKASFTAKAPVNSGVDGSKQRKKKSAMPKKGTGGRRPGNLVIRDEPLGSDEMIPALRGLSSISSVGTASLSLDLHGSVLGKRQVDGMLGFELVADATNAMVPYVAAVAGGILKKGKVDTLAEAQGGLMNKILAIRDIRTSTNRLVQDVLAWAPDQKGIFSVRSAYHLSHEEKLRASRGASSRAPDGTRAIWKVLWGCMAPPKVRAFAWKVATNSLATAANLLRRNMGVTDTCVICGKEREDTFHALCTCPLAQCLWRDMAKTWNMPKLEDI
ncbi:hypothetical protein D1007_13494 [Hordeum vulgare]|nr:hypothetical protein D1007_13494 [Hordeum vulgare]